MCMMVVLIGQVGNTETDIYAKWREVAKCQHGRVVATSGKIQGEEWDDWELLASFSNTNTNTNPAEVEVCSNWQGSHDVFFQEAEEDVDNDEIQEANE